MSVDIHTHFYPRPYIERLKQQQGIPRVEERAGQEFFVIFSSEEASRDSRSSAGRPLNLSFSDIDVKLAWMRTHNIEHSIISLGNPWFDFLPVEEAHGFARQINDLFLELTQRYSTRLSCYAALPVQNLSAALAEVVRVADAGARGVILSTRPGGFRLDDRQLWPVYGELERRGLPVLIHPHYALGGEDLHGYNHGLPVVFGFPFETTVAVARLILCGALDTFPNLQFIAAHLGGTLPYLAGRLDVWYASVGGTHIRQRPSEYLKSMYYDLLVYHAPAVACALMLVGPDRLLFGSDHPFGIADVPAVRASLLAQLLTDHERSQIEEGNAKKLFGLKTHREG